MTYLSDDEKTDKIRFTLAVLCCPLLLVFLNKTLGFDESQESQDKTFKVIKKNFSMKIKKLDIYKIYCYY